MQRGRRAGGGAKRTLSSKSLPTALYTSQAMRSRNPGHQSIRTDCVVEGVSSETKASLTFVLRTIVHRRRQGQAARTRWTAITSVLTLHSKSISSPRLADDPNTRKDLRSASRKETDRCRRPVYLSSASRGVQTSQCMTDSHLGISGCGVWPVYRQVVSGGTQGHVRDRIRRLQGLRTDSGEQ